MEGWDRITPCVACFFRFLASGGGGTVVHYHAMPQFLVSYARVRKAGRQPTYWAISPLSETLLLLLVVGQHCCRYQNVRERRREAIVKRVAPRFLSVWSCFVTANTLLPSDWQGWRHPRVASLARV